ncbi:Transposon Tf2-11 polyprotein [Nosema granulosis]|uniref:Transposon Tf2-11 polyprotein n=1 Tax=Nosema granulosis TaxID=83296 RepID=A0A9P6GYE2_9MICR|nr:Transposon Tf2-11 polyprotein [Nosema granulosis]
MNIQCDNGKEFSNSLIKEFCEKFKINLIHGRPRHPQSQGQVERFNQSLTRYLSTHLFESENKEKDVIKWIELLYRVTYQYNTAVNSATGKSPFLLFFEREGFDSVKGPLNADEDDGLINDSSENIFEESLLSLNSNFPTPPTINNTSVKEHYEKYIARMDRKAVHNSKYDFETGEFVYLKKDFDANNPKNKLDSFYYPKAKIIEILSNKRLKINMDGEEQTISMSMVKRFSNNKKCCAFNYLGVQP